MRHTSRKSSSLTAAAGHNSHAVGVEVGEPDAPVSRHFGGLIELLEWWKGSGSW